MENIQVSKEAMNYLPHLSLAERDRRWGEVRAKMFRSGLDCLLLWGNDINWDLGMVNFRYLTHIGSKHGGFAIFPEIGDPVVFSGPTHMSRPCSAYLYTQDWVSDFRPNTGVSSVVKRMLEMGFEKARIGVVGYGSVVSPTSSVTHQAYVTFEKLLPQATFVDATPLLEEMRLIKSAEEIAMLEKAGKIARKMIDAMSNTAKPGVKECEVFAEMVRTMIANGGEPTIFLLLSSGSVEGGLGTKHLLHGNDPPIAPTQRSLQKGDVIVCEFHTIYGGYMTGSEFTVFIGKAPERYRRIHQVAVECLHAQIEKMRPGVTLLELWEAAHKPLVKAGLDFLELGFHGHGMASPEFPAMAYPLGKGRISGDSILGWTLKENMVLSQNFDIFDPNWKTDVGAQLGDCCVIEAKETRRLVGVPEELPEVGV